MKIVVTDIASANFKVDGDCKIMDLSINVQSKTTQKRVASIKQQRCWSERVTCKRSEQDHWD